MTTITRTWLAMAAIGAGLIHVALGAGAPPVLAVPLIAIAVAEILWGVLTVVKDRVFTPTAALIGALAPVGLWAAVITAASVGGSPELLAPLPFLAMGSATLFDLFVAGVLAVQRRRAMRAGDPADPVGSTASTDRVPVAAAEPSVGRYLIGVLAGACVVSALTTPALANTHAGQSAVPHGTLHGVHSDH
jgi:hypothetical protein